MSDVVKTETTPESEGAQFEGMSFEEQIAALADDDSFAGEFDEAGDEAPAAEVRGEGEAESEAPGETEGEAEAEEGEAFYTPSEFAALDPFEVDPVRLSPEARAVHDRYLEVFKHSVMPELEALRAFHAKAAAESEAASASESPLENRRVFLAEVRARALKALGVSELDEFNAEHQAEVGRQSALYMSELESARSGTEKAKAEAEARASGYRSCYEELRSEIPDFDDVDVWAQDEISNLPYKRALEIRRDLASGDFGKVKSVMRMFAERYVKAHAKKAESVRKSADVPPVVIGGGGGEVSRRGIDYKAFSGARGDEQARMLVEAGLLDD